MSVTISRNSRLVYSTLREVDDTIFFERPDLPVINAEDDDTIHIVESTDRIDMLSNEYYGTPSLWWVIARANGIQLLPRDLVLGTELRIPARRRVFTDIVGVGAGA